MSVYYGLNLLNFNRSGWNTPFLVYQWLGLEVTWILGYGDYLLGFFCDFFLSAWTSKSSIFSTQCWRNTSSLSYHSLLGIASSLIASSFHINGRSRGAAFLSRVEIWKQFRISTLRTPVLRNIEEHLHLFIQPIVSAIMFGLEYDSIVLCVFIWFSPVGDRSIAGFWSSVLEGFNKGQWEATQSCKNGDALCKACGRRKTAVFKVLWAHLWHLLFYGPQAIIKQRFPHEQALIVHLPWCWLISVCVRAVEASIGLFTGSLLWSL